jgi:hypothetical protein
MGRATTIAILGYVAMWLVLGIGVANADATHIKRPKVIVDLKPMVPSISRCRPGRAKRTEPAAPPIAKKRRRAR